MKPGIHDLIQLATRIAPKIARKPALRNGARTADASQLVGFSHRRRVIFQPNTQIIPLQTALARINSSQFSRNTV
jgi:hypothetical protein